MVLETKQANGSCAVPPMLGPGRRRWVFTYCEINPTNRQSHSRWLRTLCYSNSLQHVYKRRFCVVLFYVTPCQCDCFLAKFLILSRGASFPHIDFIVFMMNVWLNFALVLICSKLGSALTFCNYGWFVETRITHSVDFISKLCCGGGLCS